MSRRVEWLGGPKDGEVFAVPDDVWEVRLAVLVEDCRWTGEGDPKRLVDVRGIRVPLVQRRDGRWLAVWQDRTEDRRD